MQPTRKTEKSTLPDKVEDSSVDTKKDVLIKEEFKTENKETFYRKIVLVVTSYSSLLVGLIFILKVVVEKAGNPKELELLLLFFPYLFGLVVLFILSRFLLRTPKTFTQNIVTALDSANKNFYTKNEPILFYSHFSLSGTGKTPAFITNSSTGSTIKGTITIEMIEKQFWFITYQITVSTDNNTALKETTPKIFKANCYETKALKIGFGDEKITNEEVLQYFSLRLDPVNLEKATRIVVGARNSDPKNTQLVSNGESLKFGSFQNNEETVFYISRPVGIRNQ